MTENAECRHKSDEDLVLLSLDDQKYFLCLMKRYEKKLFAYILRISNVPYEDAQDALQEIFIKVYKNLNSFDRRLKFSSWIYRIAHNHVVTIFRKSQSRPENVTWDREEKDAFFDNLVSKIDMEKELDRKILRERVLQSLKELDIKYREVLVLQYLEEKTYGEISDILQKPMGTVATLISRAKTQYKKILEKNII